jgi:hypothetical protein
MPILNSDQITDDDVEYYGLKVPFYNCTIVSLGTAMFTFCY